MNATLRQVGQDFLLAFAIYGITVVLLLAKGTHLHNIGLITIEVWGILLALLLCFNAGHLFSFGHRHKEWEAVTEPSTASAKPGAVIFSIRHRCGSAHVLGFKCRVKHPVSGEWTEYILGRTGPSAGDQCVYPINFEAEPAVSGLYYFIWYEMIGQDHWRELLRDSTHIALDGVKENV